MPSTRKSAPARGSILSKDAVSQRRAYKRSATSTRQIEDVKYQETVTETDTPQRTERTSNRRNRSLRQYGPTQAGERATGGVGLLEAEFLGSVFLLVLLLLFDSSKTYGDKIMSIMKRGTFVSLLFFILALIAGTGPNAAKIAKAFGGLIFVGILLTSPVYHTNKQTGEAEGLLPDIDKALRANWVGSTEHGTDVGQSDQQSSDGKSALGAASGAIQRITQIIESFGLGFIK